MDAIEKEEAWRLMDFQAENLLQAVSQKTTEDVKENLLVFQTMFDLFSKDIPISDANLLPALKEAIDKHEGMSEVKAKLAKLISQLNTEGQYKCAVGDLGDPFDVDSRYFDPTVNGS